VGIVENIIVIELVNLEGFALRLGNATNPLQNDALDVRLRKPLEYEDAEGYELERLLVGGV